MSIRAKRWLMAAAVALAGIRALEAKVPMGEEMLLNGRLEADQLAFPPYWNAREGSVRYLKEGGPDGLAAFRIEPGGRDEVSCNQAGLQTASNGVYRLRLRYRAQDAVFRTCRIGVYAGRWERFDGFALPDGTCDWQTVEKNVTAIDYPRANTHRIVFYTIGLKKGFVEFADISLTPANEWTSERTDPSSLAEAARQIRLVPMAPRLDEITPAERMMEFRFFGNLPKGVGEGTCTASFDFGAAGTVDRPLTRKPLRIRLPVGAKGGEMTATVREKATGAVLFRRVFPYGFKAAVKRPVGGRRLNNLCTELFRKELSPGRHAFAFGCPHRSWHYISVPGTVKLDGAVVLDDTFPRHETLRELSPGDHELVFELPKGGEAVVRRIAEIFNYCSGTGNPIDGYGKFDWQFTKRHVLGAVTTHNRPQFKAETSELRRAGGLVLSQFVSSNLASADDFIRRVAASQGLRKGSSCDGVTADEQYFAQSDVMNRFADGLWRTKDCEPARQRRIYSWFVGNPAVEGVDHDALSAAVNATSGRGKALYEMYFPTRPTEADARAYILARMHETLSKYDKFCPGILPRLGFIFGNFNTTTFISLWTHPQVDYKYYLDLQWRTLATDPAFNGIGTTGYWGSHDADEELHRWSFLLARHYVLEGRTDLLSDAYGLKFLGLVEDGDFTQGLAKWKASPGVEPMTVRGLGFGAQSRWGVTDGVGDTCAAFPAKESGRDSSVSQRLTGLAVGRLYRLTFCSFNVADMLASRRNIYRHGVVADLGAGAELDAARSFVSVNNRARSSANGGEARANLHVVTFRATREETVLTISDAEARTGDRLGVNFISVNPYVEAAK